MSIYDCITPSLGENHMLPKTKVITPHRNQSFKKLSYVFPWCFEEVLDKKKKVHYSLNILEQPVHTNWLKVFPTISQ